MKLSSPYLYRHYVLAAGQGPFPYQVLRYRGPLQDIVTPNTEADSSLLSGLQFTMGDLDEDHSSISPGIVLKMLSRTQVQVFRKIDGWAFIPITEGDTYHLDEATVEALVQRVSGLRDGNETWRRNGEKDRRPYLAFATAVPRFDGPRFQGKDRMTELFDMMRYCCCSWLDSDGDRAYFVRPCSERGANTVTLWCPERWRSFQWLLEGVSFAELPPGIREKLV